ncbi:double-stranded rna-binding protein 4 [Nicotiana attenuata]|uniref:Double-stranded rna-binding protein 4 n=1 Tax=Nicotiana attenuata TaxID=49451 RepID=A0A314KR99_NICAT|nr:double-stranded rna-binding protein 4 [Nicotiana attenuata]
MYLYKKVIPAPVMYKNQLQEYTQKLAKPLPIYHTVNEGFTHAPKFRSTVLVDGSKYESISTHPTKIQAEQAAAKLAYECICKKNDATECSLLYREPLLCKSILYEFAIKKNLRRPIYNPGYEGASSVFISSVSLGFRTYKGEEAGSKKMAEQVAARAAIESLLETDDGTLSQIIKSKDKFHPGIQPKKEAGSDEKILPNYSGNLQGQKDKCHPGIEIKDEAGSGEKIMPKYPGNLQGQKASIERAVVCFKSDGAVGKPGSGPKRKHETNNWGRNKMKRFGY